MAHALPIVSAVFEDVAGVIGTPATHALCERFGGTRLYIPRHISNNHPIAVVIGLPSANALAGWAGGTNLDLPKAHLRRQQVIELAKQGNMTAGEIALATDYTDRHVRHILASVREDDGQLDLFKDL